jgi:hypothetical protein
VQQAFEISDQWRDITLSILSFWAPFEFANCSSRQLELIGHSPLGAPLVDHVSTADLRSSIAW